MSLIWVDMDSIDDSDFEDESQGLYLHFFTVQYCAVFSSQFFFAIICMLYSAEFEC